MVDEGGKKSQKKKKKSEEKKKRTPRKLRVGDELFFLAV